MTAPPPVSWLYVPGDRPDRFAKAQASGAHVVILDLEDAVAPERKEQARREVLAWLPDAEPGRVEVRVNARGTPWFDDDIAALTDQPAVRAIRLPKVEQPSDADALPLPITALLESALGVENAYAIARHPGVAAVGLGEADLAADLGLDDETGLIWMRSRVVLAARAAGRPAPAMSVYTAVADLDGLRTSTERGRALGLFGRAAVHPRQIPVIHDVFRPSEAEIDRARHTLSALDGTSGVTVTADGRMVDAAMRPRAEQIMALAEELSTQG